MKRFKRVLSCLLTLSFTSLVINGPGISLKVKAANLQDGNWVYTVGSDGKATIVTTAGEEKNAKIVMFPGEVKGHEVTTIGNGSTTVSSNNKVDGNYVLFPTSVTKINDGAIYDYNATKGWSFGKDTALTAAGFMSCTGIFYSTTDFISKAVAEGRTSGFSSDVSTFDVASENNGSILPEGTYNVPKSMLTGGNSTTFKITADIGYKIKSLTADGKEVSDAVGKNEYSYEYTFSSESSKINATFEEDPNDTHKESKDSTYTAPAITEGAVASGTTLPDDVNTEVKVCGAETNDYYESTGTSTGIYYAADDKEYKQVKAYQSKSAVMFHSKAEVINYAYEKDKLVYGKDYDLIRLFNYYENVQNGPSKGEVGVYTAYLYKSVTEIPNNTESLIGTYDSTGTHTNDFNTAGILVQATGATSADRSAVTSSTKSTNVSVDSYHVKNNASSIGPSEAGNFYGLGSAILVDGGTTDATAVGKASLTLKNPLIDGTVNTVYSTYGGRLNLQGGLLFGCSSGAHGPYVSYRGETYINAQNGENYDSKFVTAGTRSDKATINVGKEYSGGDKTALSTRPSGINAYMTKNQSGEHVPVYKNQSDYPNSTVVITGDEAGTALATDTGGGTIVANQAYTKTYGLRCAGVYSIGGDKGLVSLYNSKLTSYLDAGLVSASGGYSYAYNSEIQGVMGIKTRNGNEGGNYSKVQVSNSKVSAYYDDEEMRTAYDIADPTTFLNKKDEIDSAINGKSATSISQLNMFLDKANSPAYTLDSLNWWFLDKSATPGYSGGNRFAVIYTEASSTPVYVDSSLLVNENYKKYGDSKYNSSDAYKGTYLENYAAANPDKCKAANNYIVSAEGGGTGNVYFKNENSKTHWDLSNENSETTEINGDFYVAETVTSSAPGMGSGPSSLNAHFENSEWIGTTDGYAYNANLYFDKSSSWKVTKDTTVGTIEADDISKITSDKPVIVKYQSSNTIKPGKYGNVTFVKYYSKYFSDMANYSWAANAVDSLVEDKVITETEDTKFNPSKSILRKDYIVMLYKASGSPETEVTSSFEDVSADSEYAKAVSWAVSKGILDTTIKKFKPENAVTRQDAFIYTYKALTALGINTKDGANSDLGKYTDIDLLSSDSVVATATISNLGAFDGENSDKLRPSEKMLRAEAASMLANILEKKASSGGGPGGTPPGGGIPQNDSDSK
ncbi:S-layer homology domain-containing protein [Clostridium sp. SHJSY1]|uniref:S-layer homology domain-containing protein n=1 Tax=Clostridium sp. SHJSY1 TaxID=2942483 RepID=UPI0028748FA9|nr:S-layer homology domain-containing protein [Clostridium sp. SHJSY1]MDS0525265.1 S-layer homology domain-containing protein [Clostridium sp. SHJSY1]